MSVALVTHHAMRMRPTVLSSVACLILPYFVTSLHNRYGFRENVTEHKMCVLSFYTTFAWKTSHTNRNSIGYHKCVYVFMDSTVILVRF